jgi:two-component system sensor histidine kinase AgrC
MGIVDLCRVIGILLDNAIEALEGTKGTARVMISSDEQGTVFMIANKVGAPLDLSAIFKKGYTTKERVDGKASKRGLGLYNLRLILGRYPNAAINAKLEGGEAVFRLEVGCC